MLGSWCFQNSAMLVRRLERAYQPMCTLSYHSCLWLGLVGPNSISLDFSGLGTLTNPFLTWDLGLESSFIGLTWTEWGMKPWMSQTSVHMRGDNMRFLNVYCWKHRRNPNPRPVLLYFLMLSPNTQVWIIVTGLSLIVPEVSKFNIKVLVPNKGLNVVSFTVEGRKAREQDVTYLTFILSLFSTNQVTFLIMAFVMVWVRNVLYRLTYISTHSLVGSTVWGGSETLRRWSPRGII